MVIILPCTFSLARIYNIYIWLDLLFFFAGNAYNCISSRKLVHHSITFSLLFQLLETSFVSCKSLHRWVTTRIIQQNINYCFPVGVVMMYLSQHQSLAEQELGSRVGIHLIIRMGIFSALSTIGAIIQWSSALQTKIQRLSNDQHANSLYMIIFPLLTSFLFVKQEVRNKWCSWVSSLFSLTQRWCTSTPPHSLHIQPLSIKHLPI